MGLNIYLKPYFFKVEPHILFNSGELRASLFRYPSGVEAVKLQNAKGELIILPYKGMQIWRATFLGHDLTMRTLFEEPLASTDFLKTYGGFLLHCGLTGIGTPAVEDKHAHHGELPNASFNFVEIQVDQDINGKFMAISATYRHIIGFTLGYDFTAMYKIYENASTFTTSVEIVNLRSKKLPYMYLCHINFRPIDKSKIFDTAKYEPGSYKVHENRSNESVIKWIEKLRNNLLAQQIVGNENEYYDPEVCVTLVYAPDKNGFAHTMQVLPDGYAHYVSHPVDTMPMPVRWISRTGDEDAMGMVLPATAEHLGRSNAEKKGQLKYIEPHGTTGFTMEIGLLNPEAARLIEEEIMLIKMGGR